MSDHDISRFLSDVILDELQSTRKLTNIHYGTWVRQGFSWEANVDIADLNNYVWDYESRGYDVRVGDVTFVGDEGPCETDKRAFLIREKVAA